MTQRNSDQATAQDLLALAKATAAKVGCKVTRWWLDDRDPHRLWIAAVCPIGKDTITVMLEARIADPPLQ